MSSSAARHRPFKDALYDQFARIGHALASPRRLEMLDLLSQGEKTVDALSEDTATPLKNTSAHLRVLRDARLVERRRQGQHVRYRLADEEVAGVVRALQALGRRRLAEVEAVVRAYMDEPEGLEAMTADDLRRRLCHGGVTVLDVRPADEYQAAHIPGALSVPVADLRRRLRELQRRGQVVAYCRGPYCVFADEAVRLLQRHGFAATKLRGGLPEWRARGFPLEAGAEDRP